MDKELNLIAAIRILLKWKLPLVIVISLSAFIAAFSAVYVMDEYYMSWSTVYPTNQYLSDRAMIFNTESSGGQIDYYGNKNDVNRLLSIANSAPLIDYVIDSFKLVSHYKIDTTQKFWKTKVIKKFDKNYEAIKTEREAVDISLYDTDPKLAARIVNAIVDKVDEQNKLHVNESKKRLYDLLAGQIEAQQKKVEEYDILLADLASKYNIKASSGGDGTVIVNGSDFKAVQEYKTLFDKKTNAIKELNNRINIKEQMEVSLQSNSSSLFIVEKAFPADRREKPVRWLVVTITVLITSFISLIAVLLIEQIREIKQQL